MQPKWPSRSCGEDPWLYHVPRENKDVKGGGQLKNRKGDARWYGVVRGLGQQGTAGRRRATRRLAAWVELGDENPPVHAVGWVTRGVKEAAGEARVEEVGVGLIIAIRRRVCMCLLACCRPLACHGKGKKNGLRGGQGMRSRFRRLLERTWTWT